MLNCLLGGARICSVFRQVFITAMGLHINGIKASEHGVRMGDDFLSELTTPAPAKDYVRNTSRMEHGVRSAHALQTFRHDERSVTLSFYIHGRTPGEYQTNKTWLLSQLQSRPTLITVGERLPQKTFRLLYQDAASYSELPGGTNGKLSVKFSEPNPDNRL